MNMMRIIYIGLSGVGMMFSSMASGHDAGGADFNLLRVALFATRIFVLTQMAFPQS